VIVSYGGKMSLLLNEKLPIPGLYETEGQSPEDTICWVRFIVPGSSWQWYVIEYEPKTGVFYGLVNGFEKELGYFALSDLNTVYAVPDPSFSPTPLSRVWDMCEGEEEE